MHKERGIEMRKYLVKSQIRYELWSIEEDDFIEEPGDLTCARLNIEDEKIIQMIIEKNGLMVSQFSINTIEVKDLNENDNFEAIALRDQKFANNNYNVLFKNQERQIYRIELPYNVEKDSE